MLDARSQRVTKLIGLWRGSLKLMPKKKHTIDLAYLPREAVAEVSKTTNLIIGKGGGLSFIDGNA